MFCWLCWLSLTVVSAQQRSRSHPRSRSHLHSYPHTSEVSVDKWYQRAPVEGGTRDVLDRNISHSSLCSAGKCWPATWLLGGQKCGSSSVHSWLKKTYRICDWNFHGHRGRRGDTKRSYVGPKESHFWSNQNKDELAPGDAALQFTALYPASKLPGCPNGFVEATPQLHSPSVARLLHAALPPPFESKLRFVVVLREPIARDLSAFNHQIRVHRSWCSKCPLTNSTHQSYESYSRCRLEEKALNTCAQTSYEAQLLIWAAAFSRRQIVVFEFGWLMANQADAARRIGAFLRFPALRHAVPFPHSNVAEKGGARPQKTILCDVRDRLEAVYAPENEKLYAYLTATPGPAEEPPFTRFPLMPCVRAQA